MGVNMKLQQVVDTLQDISETLAHVPECHEDVIAFTRAIEYLEYLPRLANSLDIAHTLASRHYQNGTMNEIQLLLDMVFDELREGETDE